jgi:SsrA-binding protein
MAGKSGKKEKTAKTYSPKVVNRKARFNYQLLEKLEAGIVLEGTEIKSLREGKVSLDESFCQIKDGQLYLLGCNIALYSHGNINNHEPLRKRKLLVHRRELHKIESKLSQKGLTVVPLQIYFSRGWAKVEIALAQGKTHADKRHKLKEQQVNRDVKRAMSRWR